jgi:hypothetical protein
MADKKISALTAATTPLAGTEVLPIVQTGTTVKASIANVQAAPVSAGTANAIQYLNASKAPTTSSNLLFDGAVVAVGGTSSAWSGVGNVVQLTGTALWGSGAVGHVSLNTYFDGTNYKYISTDFVTDYYQFGGSHVFRYAPSGTAGDNVAFTTAFSTTAAGNIAFPNGQGIDFSATAGTGTSELLADYEEGTWTPTDASGAGLTLVTATGFYTKIGRVVYWQANIDYPVTADVSNSLIGGLPFSITEGSSPGRSGSFITATTVSALVNTLQINPTTVRLYKAGFVRNTNAELSGATIYMAGFYIV